MERVAEIEDARTRKPETSRMEFIFPNIAIFVIACCFFPSVFPFSLSFFFITAQKKMGFFFLCGKELSEINVAFR